MDYERVEYRSYQGHAQSGCRSAVDDYAGGGASVVFAWGRDVSFGGRRGGGVGDRGRLRGGCMEGGAGGWDIPSLSMIRLIFSFVCQQGVGS